MRWTKRTYAEAALVLALWTVLVAAAPRGFFFVYLPGYLIGLGLCQLQGYYEHAHGTTSHYGRIYNTLFFRDGFHAEHHEKPSTHWRRLRATRPGETRSSAWPPVLRWLDEAPAALDVLERAVLRFPFLQTLVLRAHEPAIARSLTALPNIKRVVVIGGGLFPRTAIIMRRLLPDASITIVDRNPEHLTTARAFLGASVEVVERDCDAACAFDADLVVVPLAFVGDRDAFYDNPPAPAVLIHDWIWRRRGEGTRVSWWLLKRINVVLRRTSSSVRPAYGGRAA